MNSMKRKLINNDVPRKSLKPDEEYSYMSCVPFQKILLKGCGTLKCLYGCIKIFGYILCAGDEVPVFCPSFCPAVVIEGQELNCCKKADRNEHFELKESNNSNPKICDTDNLTLAKEYLKKSGIEFQEESCSIFRLQNGLNKRLGIVLSQAFPEMQNMDLSLKMEKNVHIKSAGKVICIPDSWDEAIVDICNENRAPRIQEENVRVMVIGSAACGKSTLCQYLLNSLLSVQKVNKNFTTRKGCCLMDLDLKQLEQSLPGTVSLSCHTTPIIGKKFILGASNLDTILSNDNDDIFSCHENLDSCLGPTVYESKRIMIGTSDVMRALTSYKKAVEELMSNYQKYLPFIINCAPLFEGHQTLMLFEIMKIVQPTHVIHISNSASNPLTCEAVNERLQGKWFNGGLSFNSKKAFQRLSYKYYHVEIPNLEAIKRDKNKDESIAITSFFSSIWPRNAEVLDSRYVKSYKINFNSLAFHVSCSTIPFSRILSAINGELVGLCSVDEKNIEEIDGLKRLKVRGHNVAMACHGWAIVRGVDVKSKTMQLIMPQCPTILIKCNIIVKTDTRIPLALRCLFYSGDKYKMFCQYKQDVKWRRECKGRLKIKR